MTHPSIYIYILSAKGKTIHYSIFLSLCLLNVSHTRTILDIRKCTAIWSVSILPRISRFSSLLTRFLETVPNVQHIICITFIFMFNNLFNSLTSYWYLFSFFFSLSFTFNLLSIETVKSSISSFSY